ncbi:MAG: hypothetical protein QOJ71_600 [Actinomycetota bacterium]|nr:hypothetical protein [Actinomycetota bacterium]
MPPSDGQRGTTSRAPTRVALRQYRAGRSWLKWPIPADDGNGESPLLTENPIPQEEIQCCRHTSGPASRLHC